MSYFEDNENYIINTQHQGYYKQKENKMKIIVKNIKQQYQTYQGNNKRTGKSYQIYSWLADIEVDSNYIQNAMIKSFTNLDFNTQKEFEGKKDERQTQDGIMISYMLTVQKKEFQKNGYSKPTYTLEEYDNLWKHALKKFENITENKQEYISTYIISAVNSNVKIVNQKIPEISLAKNEDSKQWGDDGKGNYGYSEDDKIPF